MLGQPRKASISGEAAAGLARLRAECLSAQISPAKQNNGCDPIMAPDHKNALPLLLAQDRQDKVCNFCNFVFKQHQSLMKLVALYRVRFLGLPHEWKGVHTLSVYVV